MNSQQVLAKYLKKIQKPFNSILENADKFDYFKGVEIEKPELVTPMEMELRIQADRVMFALNKAVSVLTVMAHLPYLLLDNGKLIRENFTAEESKFIFHVLKTYEHPLTDLPDFVENMGQIYDSINLIKLGGTGPKSHDDLIIDGNLLQVINMIFTNKCIRQALKNAKNPPIMDFIPNFIRDFKDLQTMAEIKLYVTGTEEEARDKRLRQAYKSNMMLTAAIKDLEEQLEIQRTQLGTELNNKVDIFEKYNKKIANIKEEFQYSIDKTVFESERKMMQQSLESEEKQTILSEEAENITAEYDKLLEDNLYEEKQLRAKTMKIKTQLQNWIVKYDQDVGDKFAEYEDIKANYDAERGAMDELQDKMEDQESTYNTSMAEKLDEEERLRNDIIFKLLMNRSARIIQRAWRIFRERKKSRKGKKQKKTQKDGKKAKEKK